MKASRNIFIYLPRGIQLWVDTQMTNQAAVFIFVDQGLTSSLMG